MAVKASPRTFSPVEKSWLAGCMATPVMLEPVFRNIQAVWTSTATTAPAKRGFRLVSDFRAVNKQLEKSPSVMPNHGTEMADLLVASCFGKLDMLQGYRQMPLAAKAKEASTRATPDRLCTPHRCCKACSTLPGIFNT